MTNKLRYFIANWKMYGDLKSLKSINKVIKFAKSNKNKRFKVIYCPPYTLLSAFCAKLQNSPLSVGAQNCHEEIDYGAFTGNVNAKMIKNLGAKYIILGHSENRANGDTDITINKKINSALKQKLTVIFCIGETFAQKKRTKSNPHRPHIDYKSFQINTHRHQVIYNQTKTMPNKLESHEMPQQNCFLQ